MSVKVAICPGSFDPVTHGHLDIVRRAAQLFDQVIVVVMTNSSKQPMFNKEERMDFLRRGHVGAFQRGGGQLRRAAGGIRSARHADVIVKGLRAVRNFEYEFQMALTTESCTPRRKRCS